MRRKIKSYGLVISIVCAVLLFAVAWMDIPEMTLSQKEGKEQEQPSSLQALAQLPKVDVEMMDSLVDFGTIKSGEIVRHTFLLKNRGNQPLAIVDVAPACGCTVPAFSKEPVLPGQTASIAIEFDSKGRFGLQQKYVTVISNAVQGNMVLRFNANVVE